MSNLLDRITEWVVAYGGQVLGALAILIVGLIGARIVRRIVRRVLVKADVAPAIVSFVARLSYVLVIVFAVVASLARFGVQTTSFVAILGAAGFAIGFALQGSLANFAAGVLILLLRPYKIGDFIVAAGQMGTVKDIQLFTTVLATPDNVKVMVPNGKIFGDTITNYSVFDTRRMDLAVGIGYESSIRKAKETLLTLAKADERVASEPVPEAMVSELADSSVNLLLRIWVDRNDYWPVKVDLTQRIKEAFDKTGDLENLLLAPYFKDAVEAAQPAWRNVVRTAIELGIPVPAFSAGLAYYDSYRSQRLPANLLQAQRDYFGAHEYQRIDKPGQGPFHTDWLRLRRPPD